MKKDRETDRVIKEYVSAKRKISDGEQFYDEPLSKQIKVEQTSDTYEKHHYNTIKIKDWFEYKTKQKINPQGHGDTWYNCTQCDYKATQKRYLKTHIDSVHKDVRYNCDQRDFKAKEKGMSLNI